MNKEKNRKNVIWLGIVSFFADMSSEMIFPILPLFMSDVLGITKSLIGLIEGIAEIGSSFFKIFFGWLSDRIRKRKLIVSFGYSLSAITKPLLAISSGFVSTLLIRFFDRVGKGARDSPRDAMISESSIRKVAGSFFGIHRMLDTLGALTGALVTFLILLKYIENYRLIFVLSFVPAVISIIILSLFVRETVPKKSFFDERESISTDFKKFIFISSLFSLGSASYAFFILRAQNIGISITFIPLIYLVYNIFYAGLSVPFGRLSDKIGRRKVLLVGYVLFALVALLFAFKINQLFAWILFALYGTSVAITDAVSRTFVSDLTGNKKGTAYGAYHTITGITAFFASFLFGIIWDSMGVSYAFYYSSILAFLSAFCLFFLLRKG